jgi:AmmeMemoRadiSam system protein B
MQRLRRAAVAGRFYPADAGELRSQVEDCLKAASGGDLEKAPRPKGIIVPHAGYVYSGPIAASAYARIAPLRGTVDRVVLCGPAHFARIEGLATTSAEFFETPLGPVAVGAAAIEQLRLFPQVHVTDRAHEREHSLEVQLPFLQETLGEFQIVPLAIGDATVGDVAEVFDALWGGPDTLFVISSDLSHFHDYETARELDSATSLAIEEMRVDSLRGERACGYLGIGGFLTVARERGLSVERVDLRNSGDTAGSRDRVVGYGSYVIA